MSDVCWKESENESASASTEVKNGSGMMATSSETAACRVRETLSESVLRTVPSSLVACSPPLQSQGKVSDCSLLLGTYYEY